MALHPLYLSEEVCPLHPEWRGKRFPLSGECIMCARPAVFMETYRKERREKSEAARERRIAARTEGSLHYLGKLCSKHPELMGKRYVSTAGCVGCSRSRTSGASAESAAVRANRAAAKESKQPYYLGSVCSKHRELQGARHTVSGNCVGCQSEARKRKLGNKAPSADTPHRYHGVLCDKHPKEKGLRYKANNLCVACARERAKEQYERQKVKRNKEEVVRVLEAQRQLPDDRS